MVDLLFRIGLIASVAALPYLFTTAASEFFEFPKLLAIEAGALILGLCWLAKRFGSDPVPRVRTVLDRPALAWLAVLGLSTATSILPWPSFGLLAHSYGSFLSNAACVFGFFAVTHFVRDRRTVSFLLHLAVMGGIPVALYAILQHYSIDFFPWNVGSHERVFSTIGQPNYLGGYFIMLLALTCVLPWTTEGRRIWPLHVVATVLLLAALVWTFSRAAWIGATLVLTTVVLIDPWVLWPPAVARRRMAIGLAACALAGIGVLGFSPRIRDRVISIFDLKGATAAPRFLVWSRVPAMVREAPLLGSGPETFLWAYPPHRPAEMNQTVEWDTRPSKAHNEYLNVLATTGLLGFAAYAWLLFAAARAAIRGLRACLERPSMRDTALLLIGLTAGVVGFLAQNFFGFTITQIGVFFWGYLALIVRLPALAEVSGPDVVIPSEARNLPPGPDSTPSTAEIPRRGVYPERSRRAPRDDIMLAGGIQMDPARSGRRSAPPPFVTWAARGAAAAGILLTILGTGRLIAAEYAFSAGSRHASAAHWSEAISLLQQAEALVPGDDSIERRLAESWGQAGPDPATASAAESAGVRATRAEAEKVHLRCVAANPYETQNWTSWAQTSLRHSKGEDAEFGHALERYRRAIGIDPTNARLHYNVGMIYFSRNRLAEAEASLNEAARLRPEFLDVHRARANLYLRMNDPVRAGEIFRRILELDPTDKPALAASASATPASATPVVPGK